MQHEPCDELTLEDESFFALEPDVVDVVSGERHVQLVTEGEVIYQELVTN